MLIFIIPLQSPEASRDWEKVSQMAIRSLRSACQQDCDEFRVILVCNRKPIGMFEHPALKVIEEDFPLPGADQEKRMRDKGDKIKRGLIEARSESPCHFMFMDADDCVHRDLAGLSSREPDANGWIFTSGYFLDRGSRWAYLWPDFNLYCGTSHITRRSPEEIPVAMDEPDELFPLLNNEHHQIAANMRERGTPLVPLPFPGAVYNTDTGENYSQIALNRWRGRKMFLRKLLRARPVTSTMRKTFGLYELE